MAKDKTGKKIRPPTDKQYREEMYQVALGFAPHIYACAKCGWPVAQGYCCGTCGDTDPQSED